LTGAEDIAASFVFCDACQPPMIHAEMLFYHFITSFSGLSGFFQFPWKNMEQKALCSEIILQHLWNKSLFDTKLMKLTIRLQKWQFYPGGYARFVRISCAFCPFLLRVLSISK
jgi:hypothetical protein